MDQNVAVEFRLPQMAESRHDHSYMYVWTTVPTYMYLLSQYSPECFFSRITCHRMKGLKPSDVGPGWSSPMPGGDRTTGIWHGGDRRPAISASARNKFSDWGREKKKNPPSRTIT